MLLKVAHFNGYRPNAPESDGLARLRHLDYKGLPSLNSSEMGPIVPDIDHLSSAISHATAPAFMLGAVAGFLSILVARLERIVDRNRNLRSASPDAVDPASRDAIAAAFERRMVLLSRAIYFAVLSALVTAALLISAFLAALVGIGHGGIIALMFTGALALLMASLVELTREIRIHMANMHLD